MRATTVSIALAACAASPLSCGSSGSNREPSDLRLDGVYVPQGPNSNGKYSSMVFRRDGTYEFTRFLCETACLDSGRYTFDSAGQTVTLHDVSGNSTTMSVKTGTGSTIGTRALHIADGVQLVDPIPCDTSLIGDAVVIDACFKEPGESEPQCFLKTVEPFKELMIVHPSVVQDARADNASCGPWSFCGVMTRIHAQAGPNAPPLQDFVNAWVDTYRVANDGDVISANPQATSGVAGGGLDDRPYASLLYGDPRQSPLQLIAIVFRPDIEANSGGGEGRFVFGLPGDGGLGLIFEFGLLDPPDNPDGTANRPWVAQFHQLGELPFGDSYNGAVQHITDQFTTAPGGQIDQVRANENKFGGKTWTLREWHLDKDVGKLAVANVKNTPDDSFKSAPKSAALVSWINAHADTIKANRTMIAHGSIDLGLGTGAGGFLGLESREFLSGWSLYGVADSQVRDAFALGTCSGCHFFETEKQQLGAPANNFFHVSPVESNPNPPPAGLTTLRDGDLNGVRHLSDFVLKTELEARKTILAHRLCLDQAPTN